MRFSADALVAEACEQTGLSDFGGDYYGEGLDRLIDAINSEADLNETGELIQHASLVNLLACRLSIEETYRQHPEIEDAKIEGPVFVIGLPRTGTTALSQLVAADPQFRSLRTWESSAPTPPPEAATQHTDPRIAKTAENLAMMDMAFPLMKTMHNAEPEAPTECQDLMGMSFRTMHFDGMLRVPTYLSWVLDCDMDGTYAYHRRVLKLLQWHCPPNLWHLKTPVHIFALSSLVKAYPDAKFLWSHRDPAPVLASVCSLIAYVRSWSSDRTDPVELGPEMVACWSEGIRRAMDFRSHFGDDRFVDVPFADLQNAPVDTLQRCYSELGLEFSDASRTAVTAWAEEHKRGSHGEHTYDLADYGLTANGVREHFAAYLDRYDASN
jgi:Sulfotransferase family